VHPISEKRTLGSGCVTLGLRGRKGWSCLTEGQDLGPGAADRQGLQEDWGVAVFSKKIRGIGSGSGIRKKVVASGTDRSISVLRGGAWGFP